MKPENAHFKPLDFWKNNRCNSLEGVLDFARCLEDTAFPVIREWYVFEGSEEQPQPLLSDMLSCKKCDLTVNNNENPKTGWFMALMPVPYISKFFNKEDLGEYVFSYYTGLDLDIYCDDRLIEPYSYMGGNFRMGVTCEEKHYVFLRVDSPNSNPVSDLAARCSLTGACSLNEVIKDLSRSLRAGCHLLSRNNTRNNLYLKGNVDIDNSKITDNERKELEKCLIDTANFTIEKLNADDFSGALNTAVKMLKPVSDYARRFTLYFIGHSHIDLAWKWRYPESIECMKGTFETQLSLMEREPDYVYVETSAVLWKDMQKKYPEFWKKIREASKRGQFEPQGGMWCETDCQCVGAESWFRQIEFGQKAAEELCGKKSTVAVNIDAFGFNAGLPKILTKAGFSYFVTQKLRYNEYTLFPFIHFWWKGDDGSKILVLHEYPSHANHIEPDELAKITCIHHLTDGFYNIPILWGYGNHGGGPLPVMMDRIDELKKQTVFPNIEYSGLTKFYEILKEKEDLNSLPTVEGELFLETHHKTYTVQGKTKYLNRECERRLLNSESLQAATGNFYDISGAWEKQLFNQFHDVLAGTSLPQVYLDLYNDYNEAFRIIDKANKSVSEKYLGSGNETFVFNPLSQKLNIPVIIDSVPQKEKGILTDSNGNGVYYQKTYDNKTVFITENLLPFSFQNYRFSDKTTDEIISSSEDFVDNGIIKVKFDKSLGVINSLIFDGKEYCKGVMGKLKILEDIKSRDYDTWNFGFTGKEWDVKCNSFEQIENGPVRTVFKATYSFGIWQEKKPYYGTYLWHTPGVEYPTSFFTQYFIIYRNNPMIYCVLDADWWEDRKVLKLSAETSVDNPSAFYQVPFGVIERPVKRETPYEKARFEVPANTYGDLRNGEKGFAVLNRSKHGYDALDNRLQLTLLTSPYNSDRAKVPDSSADRGKHRIEYAFLPHGREFDLEGCAEVYERGIMILKGNKAAVSRAGKSLIDIENVEDKILSVRLKENGEIHCRTIDKNKKIGFNKI